MKPLKYTTGQWIINKDNSISTNSFDKVLIAQVCSANNNEQEQIANAKLIAAAPELLEACIKAYNYMATSPLTAMELLEKAILKATK
jgi:hypothetical protein